MPLLASKQCRSAYSCWNRGPATRQSTTCASTLLASKQWHDHDMADTQLIWVTATGCLNHSAGAPPRSRPIGLLSVGANNIVECLPWKRGLVPEGQQHVARGGPPRVTRVLAKPRVKSRSPNGREMRVDGNCRHAEAARAGAHFGLGMLQLNRESLPRPTTRTIRSPGEENYLLGVRATITILRSPHDPALQENTNNGSDPARSSAHLGTRTTYER